ncbi:caspase-3-like [Haliotis rubra]|uniref:caspase-3-like n=1 Tax=Haliotis rubra TaxID=36100 RepID=UPI001EE5E0E2|nr:caspase-3-like [Haliotis rubra]
MAMTNTHKDILIRNRGGLVDNIANIAAVVNELFSMETITAHMKEDILEGKHHTPRDKKWALLDLLPRRGDGAFDHFHTALIKCGEQVAADILKPPAPQPQQPTDDLPESWPPVDYSTNEVKVEMVAEDNIQMRQWFEESKSSSMIYRMEKCPRGRVLIINNKNFSAAREKKLDLEDRTGTDEDATSLCLLFDDLSLDKVVKKDLTREKIIEVLDEERQLDHDGYDCFACVILSHGTGGGVYGVDGEVANIQEITDMFNGQNCQTLVGKPKLFFIQACQGQKKDTGAESAPDPTVSEVTQELESIRIHKEPQTEKQNLVATTSSAAEHPPRADIMIAEATTPDYMSVRNTVNGSWFIQAIVYVFMKFAHKEDLASMMTKVNDLVCRRVTKNKKYKQVSTYSSVLTKHFYFFPGLPQKTS